jgi:hypothetical protein
MCRERPCERNYVWRNRGERLLSAVDDPAPPGDANPTTGTTMNTTHKTATLRRTKPPLSESHSPAEATRASNTSISPGTAVACHTVEGHS